MDKVDFYFKVLNRYDLYVQLANTKASNHITLLASMLVAVTALVGWGIEKIQPVTSYTPYTFAVASYYLFFLCICYTWYSNCMKVIQPNRDRNVDNSTNETDADLSCIFYSDVSKFSDFTHFKDQANKRTDEKYLDDLMHQVFIMARITEKKFNDYQQVNNDVRNAAIISILILILSIISKLGEL